MNWRRRSSSALGRLETSNESSILNAATILGTKGERRELRAQTCPPGQPPSNELELTRVEAPAWLLQACLTRQRMRSHSIGMEDLVQGKTPPHHTDLARRLRAEKIEHQMTLEELQDVYALFQDYEKKGRQLLDMETFKSIMKQSMRSQNKSIEQIEQLFMKIDYEAGGRIQWDGLCTYLQLQYSEQAKALARQKEVSFQLPAVLQRLSYGGPVLRILPMPDDTFIMIREDGAIYLWSPRLNLERRKQLFDKATRQKPRWVTDVVSMPQYNKLIVGTGNRELQLYEVSNLEPYCQIGSLEAVPLKLDYCYEDPDKCLILFGDDQGCVNILLLASVGELLRTWKKLPRVENMPTISIYNAAVSPNVNFICWKVHGDWVTQLNYYDSIKAIISSCNHEPTALVIGCTLGKTNVEQKMKELRDAKKDGKQRKSRTLLGLPQKRAEYDQTVFRIHKGVKAFSFCRRKSLLLTGGMDRIIRIWNPYMPGKPTGVLKNHTAPVIYIHISAEDDKIFSMSIDNTIKIWDLDTYNCLFSASSKASGIKGELSSCLYLPGPRALCVAADTAALLHLKLSSSAPDPRRVVSHREPVVRCRYNPTFCQMVSCSEGSVVKVWDFETGRLLSEFSGAHGNSGITCLAFDSSGRRLITGGRDGCLKIWSYNNGHCLHTLKCDESSSEVCDCVYLEVNQNKYIIAVGWDRRINMYFDAPHDFHHFWKPQPHWKDDLDRGHKEDILCVAHCPPFFLATSSYDGEIIVWNVISGHVYCRMNTPSPSDGREAREGPDRSVSCLAFLKTRAAKSEPAAAALLANGPQGSLVFWRLLSNACPIAAFAPSRNKAQVSSLAVSAGDTLSYVADEEGFVHVYSIMDYGLRGMEPQPPKNVMSWRAHVSLVTCLELVEERFLLSASLDCAAHLWSMNGEHIGTFGQSSPWDIFTPASWSHPRVPCEVLTDPQSMPAHLALEVGVPAEAHPGQKGDSTVEGEVTAESQKTPGSPLDTTLEPERSSELRRWLLLEQSKCYLRTSEQGWPSIYQTLRCHEIASIPPVGEKPDLSLIRMDVFHSPVLPQGQEGSEMPQAEC